MTATSRSAKRREPVYTSAVALGRLLFGGLLRLKPVVMGAERIPSTGPAVLAITHFGYLDFALVEWVTWLRTRRRVRFLVLKEAFDRPLIGRLLGAMRHIRVDRSAGAAAFPLAVDALRDGEMLGVFPEAGVSASFTVRRLKSGAVRMAAEAGVPVVPVVVWGGHLLKTKNHRSRLSEAYRAPIRISVGEPLRVSAADDVDRATDELREAMQALLDDAQATYPLPGDGRWWQPAHLGGTAPTPEQAAADEAERRRRRAAVQN